jgi:hypothetical protein
MSEVQRSAAMSAVVVEQHEAAVRKAQEEVRVVSGFDEVELFRIESYDKHDSKMEIKT